MRQEDLLVEVRDKTLTRVGAIPADLLTMEATDVHNNVGTWKLSLNAEHPLASVLSAPGAGIIVTGPTSVLFSGPVTKTENAVTATDPLGTLTVEGVDDTIILADMLAWPDPANGNAATQNFAYDERSGPAESLMHAYVNANVGPSAPANRRRAGLIMGTNGARGATVSKSARFETLGELCSSLADPNGLGFRIVQRGPTLVFETYAVADRTKDARLGVTNNTLAGQRVSTTPPAKTQVIVGGDGDGSNRLFVGVNSPASVQSEADWGRRIENFVDERSTTDTAELTQKGADALADGGSTMKAAQAVPMEDSALDFGRDWFLGDRVSVIVGGSEMAALVTGMTLKVDSDGYRIGATLGDPTPLSADAAATSAQKDLEGRVSSLERTAEATPAGPREVASGALTQASATTAWPEGASIMYLTSTQATAGGWDFGGKVGYVTCRRFANGDAVQTWSRVHASATAHEEWVRGGNAASGWSAWRQVGFDNQLVPGSTFTQSALPSAYPYGVSTLTMNETQAAQGGWDFGNGGKYGTLRTVHPAGATFAHQTWLRLSPTVTEEWYRSGNDAAGWTAWKTAAHAEQTPRGVLALQTLGTTAYVGDTETMVYTQQFTAEAGRCYKVVLRIASVDTDATGDNASTRYAKQSAMTVVRWASGSTVASSNTAIGSFYSTTFNDDSNTSNGMDAAFYLNSPPAGPITIGIGLMTKRAAATYGMVRYLPSTLSTLAIEDVGAAV
ncbi:siphovirus ReqiPepy6 Gp37-like family protein [Streptomyces sp. NPDC001009]